MDQENVSKKILTIPNLLSLVRLILAGLFAVVYWNAETRTDYYLSAVILVLSGLTDFADGKIARHFNMISELGKILDPISDKVTQVVVAACLCRHYDAMRLLVLVLVIKEICQGIYGGYALRMSGQNDGAMLCGKISTFYLYAMMVLFLLVPGIPLWLSTLLTAVAVCLLVWSFISYIVTFRSMIQGAKEVPGSEENP